jgi:hypothetical protein
MNRPLLVILLLLAQGQAEWRQSSFIIGGWDMPDVSSPAIPESTCLDRLEQVRNAGINVLVALRDRPPAFTPISSENKRLLSMVSKVSGLKVMVNDWKVLSESLHATALYYSGTNAAKGGLSIEERNTLYGYFLRDEPSIAELPHLLSIQSALTAADPEKISWINLFPYNQNRDESGNPTSSYFRNWQHYRKYVSNLFTNPGCRVASFDYYPFWNSGWQITSAEDKMPYYFRSLQLFAEQAAATGKVFWCFPLSSDENLYDINKTNIRFTAFAPLVYGAKGIIWYTYATPAYPGARRAMVGTDSLESKTEIYNWVQATNTRVAKLGAMLLDLHWQGTYHGSVRDFDSHEPLSVLGDSSCGDPTRTVLPSRRTPLTSISSDRIAVGSFEKHDTTFLLVFNKDRSASRNAVLAFAKPLSIWRYSEATAQWSLLSGSDGNYKMENIGAADVVFLRLTQERK